MFGSIATKFKQKQSSVILLDIIENRAYSVKLTVIIRDILMFKQDFYSGVWINSRKQLMKKVYELVYWIRFVFLIKDSTFLTNKFLFHKISSAFVVL